MTILKAIYPCLLCLCSLLFFSNCSSVDPFALERSDEDLAADVLVNNRHSYHVKRIFDTIDPTQFVVISLESSSANLEEKSQLTLTYNRNERNWRINTAYYKNDSSRLPRYELVWEKEGEPSEIAWLELMTALEGNNLLFIPEKSMSQYVSMNRGGEKYLLGVRIADRYKEAEWVRPVEPEGAGRSNESFKKIVTILQKTFGEINAENN